MKRQIKLHFIPPYSHKSAGIVERMNATVLERLRRMASELGKPERDWVQTLPRALEQIITLPHRMIGYLSQYLC